MTAAAITAIILTRDEELNLPSCLASLAGVVDEIFVVDSGSTDRTCEIAEAHGATVVQHPFTGHSDQWEWAIRNLPIRNTWILGLDADHRVTPELASELRSRFAPGAAQNHIAGFYVARRNVFRGRWIRWGGYYPKYLLKLFNRERIRFDAVDLLDHHFRVEGRTERLNGDIIEENRKEEDIDFWITKHLAYAELAAREELRREGGHRSSLVKSSMLGNPDERAEWQKETWRRLPAFARPAGYFLWRYFFRLGFLDGKEGFAFHFLHAFWFRLVADLKLEEIRKHDRPRD